MNPFTPVIQTEIDLLDRLIAQAEEYIKKAPGGTIYARRTKNGMKFFQIHQGEGNTRKYTYIPIKDQQLICQLLQKRTCMRNLPKMQSSRKALLRCKSQLQPFSTGGTAGGVYNSKKGIFTAGGAFYPFDDKVAAHQEIKMPYMCDSWSPEVKAWMQQSVRRNTKNLGELKHLSSRGVLTRSKSEAAIATMLESHFIPYKYDCVIELDGGFVSPDFMIMRPRDGIIIFWEHYGLVTELKYALDMNRKRTIYLASDITPWNTLIESYDDGSGALDLQVIEGLIKGFLL